MVLTYRSIITYNYIVYKIIAKFIETLINGVL